MTNRVIAPNLSIREACDIGGWSRSWFYSELRRPESEVPRPIKIGNRSYVRSDELDEFIKSRPRVGVPNTLSENTEINAAKTAERN
jgi:predicted DNA-binding transcriptional regulator AlpA